MAIYGRSGLPDWNSGTAYVSNGATGVVFTAANLVQTDATTGATLYAAGRGDLFVVPGVGSRFISSVDSINGLTLVEPWAYASQTNVTYAIIRMSFPQTGSVAKAINDLYATGSDTNPDLSRTIDDTTARVKLKLLAGVPTVAVGPSGTADASLKAALQASTAGVISFPSGATPAADWNNNRCINGGFDIWQNGTTFSVANNTSSYTADQWQLINNSTGGTLTLTRNYAFYGEWAAKITGSCASGSFPQLRQPFEAQALNDLDGAPITVSFDLNATTSAGTITYAVRLDVNTGYDNDTFSNTLAQVNGSISPGSNRISVTFTAAQTVGVKNGAAVSLFVVQNGAVGTITAFIGAVQIEKGIVASPFIPKPIWAELAACQRFFCTSWPNLYLPTSGYSLPWYLCGQNVTQNNYMVLGFVQFPMQMRSAPTVTFYDSSGVAGHILYNGTTSITATAGGIFQNGFTALYNTSTTTINLSSGVNFNYSASARL